jgi:hypothetical protein
MNWNQHLDKFIAVFVFLIAVGVFMKSDSEFAKGLVTGAMLTISTLLRGIDANGKNP